MDIVLEQQMELNKNKNLFYENMDSLFDFSSAFKKAILSVIDGQCNIAPVIDSIVSKVSIAFAECNQFISLTDICLLELKNVYYKAYLYVKKHRFKDFLWDGLKEFHFLNLQGWLKRHNSFLEEIYPQRNAYITPFICGEYSSYLQFNLLNLNRIKLEEPILDIGCGSSASLVRKLKEKGLKVEGVDRFCQKSDFLINSDWFDFYFKPSTYGTVISNIAFTNHFIFHHRLKRGNYLSYAKKYREILNSLKKGGCFIYAPSLPFIEKLLDNNEYFLCNYDVGNTHYKMSVIKRLTS